MIHVGAQVSMRVPGSSANLGPGYDAVGLALGFYDSTSLQVLDSGDGSAQPGAEIRVTGEHADEIPCDETNLVVRSFRAALARVGATQPRIRMQSRLGVPFGRGVGSSAAAVISGVAAAQAVLADPSWLDAHAALEVACDIEGHPDNVAASLLGGMTLGWSGAGGAAAVRVEPHAELLAVVAIPASRFATSQARSMLPSAVPHADAAYNAGRAALLVEAVTHRPDLLLPATSDRLHQIYRSAAMPPTAELIQRLRHDGHAAVMSGAGPSVLVLGTAPRLRAARVAAVAGPGWQVHEPGIDRVGVRME